MSRILASPSSMGKVGDEPFDLLRSNGYQIINNPYGRKLTEDEVIELAKDCIGIVAGVEPLNKKVLDALPNLKCISRVGVGMDSVDLDYAKQKGISVVNTPNGPTRAVAELAFGLTFALLRKIPQADADMKALNWQKQTGNLVINKKIGIIGLGRIGRTVAKLFTAIGNEVIAYDLYPDNEWAHLNKIEIKSLEAVLSESDIVSLHIPSSGEKPLLDADKLNLMKTNSFLINLSRGGVVDEKALCKALKSNSIKGAAIDVFKEEPYSGELCTLDNVILTPHIGSYAEEGKLKMEIDAVQNLIDVLNS